MGVKDSSSLTSVWYIVCQLETVAVADFDVERRRDIPLWIIIVSVVAGFILLALVIFLLWKVSTPTQRLSFRFWPTVLSVAPLVHCVVCLSSVTFCIVAKRYVVAKNCLKE